MKKFFAVILAIMMLCGATAMAEAVKPIDTVHENELDTVNNVLDVSFRAEDITETGIRNLEICRPIRYEMDDIDNLKEGDSILFLGEEITIQTIEKDYSVFLNGGFEGEGVTLTPEGGTYMAVGYEAPLAETIGHADLPFAETVIYRHWQQTEDGSILEELSENSVAGNDLKGILLDEGDEYFDSREVTILVQDGKITEMTIRYLP